MTVFHLEQAEHYEAEYESLRASHGDSHGKCGSGGGTDAPRGVCNQRQLPDSRALPLGGFADLAGHLRGTILAPKAPVQIL